MVPLGGIFAFVGRQAGKILNTAFAWATTALFGQVPKDKSLYLSGMALGALLWPVVVAGIAFPSVATFLLAFVTLPPWADAWVRPVMLALAILLPPVVGLLGSRIESPPPKGGALLRAVIRGYPTTVGLFVVLLWMLVLAPAVKVRAVLRRWDDAHVAIAVKPQGYDTVVRDLAAAMGRAGVPVRAVRAHWVFEVPGRVLAALGGARVRRLVPARLMVLRGEAVECVVHPMDLSLRGRKGPLAHARAAIARELTFTEANQTWTKEAQDIEDALAEAARGGADLAAIARRIETVELDYEQWEVLYRLLLQVRLRTTPLSTDAIVSEREPIPPFGVRWAGLRRALRMLWPARPRAERAVR